MDLPIYYLSYSLFYLFSPSFSATVVCGPSPNNVPIFNPCPHSPCLSNTSGGMDALPVGTVVDGIASGELVNGRNSLSPAGPGARLAALPLRLVARDP
jgi:hypothetical protein